MDERRERWLFRASVAMLLVMAGFGYGVLVGAYDYWPYSALTRAKSAIQILIRTGTLTREGLLVQSAARAPRERVTIYDTDRALDGYFVLLGWSGATKRYTVWVYDSAGREVHTWALAYEKLDPDGPRNGSDMPHGLHVLRDGSLVVNFDLGDVMARLDACGEPIWVKEGIFHHSIDEAEDGTLWTWRGRGTAFGSYQYIVNIDPRDGSTLEEIDLIEDVIRPLGPQADIFNVRPNFVPRNFDRDPPERYDIFHPNDVEVLRSEFEDRFPGFSAGDLLISFRELNLVAVLDRQTKRMKWWSHGPWRRQHDPDFTADGLISVFDNNTSRGRSEVLNIDPVTREIRNPLINADFSFYSGGMGKHQYLPNGDLLLVVPEEGRMVLFGDGGEKLIEFNNVVSAKYNAHIENGMWLPNDYFDEPLDCPRTQ